MEKGSKVYIAGKIGGEKDAREKFEEAEKWLIKNGYQAINPMKLPHNHDKSWEAYMKECIHALIECDYIIMLPMWSFSPGAVIEHNLAKSLKIGVYYFKNNACIRC